MYMKKRTLILSVDLGNSPEWHKIAIQRQLGDWLESNKALLPMEDIIIFCAPGDTKLYWLEGKHDGNDIKTLEEIKDRIKPVLEVTLGGKPNVDKSSSAFTAAMQKLRSHREKYGK